jgi:hypothetical protein
VCGILHSQGHKCVREPRVFQVDLGNVRICTGALGGAGGPAGSKLAMEDLGNCGRTVLGRLGGCADGVRQDHDGRLVCMAGKIRAEEEDCEDDENVGLVLPGVTGAPLHRAASAAAAAESVGRG